jgi:threonine synthase
VSAARLFECSGCGARISPGRSAPVRCPAATPGDDVDHLVVRRLGRVALRFPVEGAGHPFVRYRELLGSYRLARAAGWSDARFVSLVERLDDAVAAADGRGFEVTPFWPAAALGRRLGFAPPGVVWVKDETGNVAGSHKARHLFGVALYLEIEAAARPSAPRPRLAIASCGNAALAAATLARAMGRPLDVYVPPDAEPEVLDRLNRLDAHIHECPRVQGERGDPCVAAFHRAVAGGAYRFTCQGSENGLVIEGGQTLGYEIADSLAARGMQLDRLFVQVGGGALASAVVTALREAATLGAVARPPRIHAVQTRGCAPLARAHGRLTARLLEAVGEPADDGLGGGDADARHADRLHGRASEALIREQLHFAATHRSQFMWPWEEPPRSIARGILDDETYDWRAVVAGMIESGGWPVVVGDDRLAASCRIARETTGVPVSATGASGLAGLMELREVGHVGPAESVAVLFTGAEHRGLDAVAAA